MAFCLSQSAPQQALLLGSSLAGLAADPDPLYLVSEEGWLLPAPRLLLLLRGPALGPLLAAPGATSISVPAPAATLSALLSLLAGPSSPPGPRAALAPVSALAAALGLELPGLLLEPSIAPSKATQEQGGLAISAKMTLRSLADIETTGDDNMERETDDEDLKPAAKIEHVVQLKGETEEYEAVAEIIDESTEIEWPCKFCEKRFQQVKYLTAHHKVKHPEQSMIQKKIYQCQDCPRFFSSRKPFNKHKYKHKNVKEFECKICNEKFDIHRDLQVHVKGHDDAMENPIAVAKNQGFIKQDPGAFVGTSEEEQLGPNVTDGMWKDIVETETNMETELNPFEMQEDYNNILEATNEEETETDLSITNPAASTINENLTMPINEHLTMSINEHQIKEVLAATEEAENWFDIEWTCGNCPKRFAAEKFINTHHESKHGAETKTFKKVFACKECPKSFAILNNLKNHRKVHC